MQKSKTKAKRTKAKQQRRAKVLTAAKIRKAVAQLKKKSVSLPPIMIMHPAMVPTFHGTGLNAIVEGEDYEQRTMEFEPRAYNTYIIGQYADYVSFSDLVSDVLDDSVIDVLKKHEIPSYS